MNVNDKSKESKIATKNIVLYKHRHFCVWDS